MGRYAEKDTLASLWIRRMHHVCFSIGSEYKYLGMFCSAQPFFWPFISVFFQLPSFSACSVSFLLWDIYFISPVLCRWVYPCTCICTGNITTSEADFLGRKLNLALEVFTGRYTEAKRIFSVWHSSASYFSCFAFLFRSWLGDIVDGEAF